MNKKIFILIVAILVVGSLVFLTNKKSKVTPITKTPKDTVTSQPLKVNNEVIVTVKSTGFDPSSLNIKKGQRVVWVNKSGGKVTVNSNNHPTHLVYPPLNLGEFKDGFSVQLVFGETGKFGYHNHYNPSQTGEIIVE